MITVLTNDLLTSYINAIYCIHKCGLRKDSVRAVDSSIIFITDVKGKVDHAPPGRRWGAHLPLNSLNRRGEKIMTTVESALRYQGGCIIGGCAI